MPQMSSPEDETWEWVGKGTQDIQIGHRRIHYKQLSLTRTGHPGKRLFKVGDPVVMCGDDGQVWIAQIVDFFQAKQNDQFLRDLIRSTSARNSVERRHELMRCTLRWFYNLSDMNQHTLNTSRAPKPVHNEIWFSDHVEQDGFNDVQVIEGKAWLFPNSQAMNAFLKDPDPEYDRHKDKLRVVRCFVDYKSDQLPVRELERTELERLLRSPSTAKDLFENSRLRLFGSAGAVLKGTGKKKRRRTHLREPVDVDEDAFEPTSPFPERRAERFEAKGELGSKGAKALERTKERPTKRRKIIDNDDEDDDDDESEDGHATKTTARSIGDEPLSGRAISRDQQRAPAFRFERENQEVFAWVTELNNSVFHGDAKNGQKRGDRSQREARSSGGSSHRVSAATSAQPDGSKDRGGGMPSAKWRNRKGRQSAPETVIIDGDGDTSPSNQRRRDSSRQPSRVQGKSKDDSSLPHREPRAAKNSQWKSRTPFMPTQRATKATSGASPSNLATANNGTSASDVPAKKTSESHSHGKNAVPTKGNLTASRQTSEKIPSVSGKQSNLSASSTAQETSVDGAKKPSESEFLGELKASLEALRRDFARLPAENKRMIHAKIDWVVESVIDLIFDGGKKRNNAARDHQVRELVNIIYEELDDHHSRSAGARKLADGSRARIVKT